MVWVVKTLTIQYRGAVQSYLEIDQRRRMGNAETLRGRLTPAVVVAVLLALAAAVTLGVLARPAAAQEAFTTCSSCHTLATTHSSGNASHTGIGCTTCHNNGGTANAPLPSACASCHGATAVLTANATHTSAPQSCASTVGCHGVQSPTPTPTPTATVATTKLTVKVAPTSVKVKKSVKFSGVAGPAASLVGAKVSLKVERKVGTKWVKMKTGTATVKATTGAYSWSYKTAKKGSHRVTASIAKSSTHTAKKLAPKTFKVK
jgi:hypothetical protein